MYSVINGWLRSRDLRYLMVGGGGLSLRGCNIGSFPRLIITERTRFPIWQHNEKHTNYWLTIRNEVISNDAIETHKRCREKAIMMQIKSRTLTVFKQFCFAISNSLIWIISGSSIIIFDWISCVCGAICIRWVGASWHSKAGCGCWNGASWDA